MIEFRNITLKIHHQTLLEGTSLLPTFDDHQRRNEGILRQGSKAEIRRGLGPLPTLSHVAEVHDRGIRSQRRAAPVEFLGEDGEIAVVFEL